MDCKPTLSNDITKNQIELWAIQRSKFNFWNREMNFACTDTCVSWWSRPPLRYTKQTGLVSYPFTTKTFWSLVYSSCMVNRNFFFQFFTKILALCKIIIITPNAPNEVMISNITTMTLLALLLCKYFYNFAFQLNKFIFQLGITWNYLCFWMTSQLCCYWLRRSSVCATMHR